MKAEEQLESDLVDVPDDEKIVFSDKEEKPVVEAKAEIVTPPQEGEQSTDEERKQRRGKDYQKRMNEVIRRAHEAEEREAAVQTRLALAEEELKTLREKSGAAAKTSLEQRESSAVERKKLALEKSDFEAYDAAAEELIDIRIQKATQTAEPVRRVEAPKVDDDAPHPSAAAWMSRNEWIRAAGNQALAAEAVRIERRLRTQDRIPLGDDLYKKLDEELAQLPEFDEVRGVAPEEAEEEAPKPVAKPRATVAGPSRGGEPPAKPTRAGALTEHDKANMRRFKLDPSNPKHRDTYLQYRR